MKPVISIVFIAFFVFCISGCGNQTSSLTKDDSLAVASDYAKHHPEVSIGGTAAGSFYHVDTRLRIGQDSLDHMRHAYDSVMTWHIPNPYGGWVTGFIVDTADFNDAVRLANAGKLWTVGFHFAIRNYTQFAQGAAPLYTMEVVPVGPKWQPFPAGLRVATPATPTTQATSTSYGYDFVDPCPGGLGCPPTGN